MSKCSFSISHSEKIDEAKKRIKYEIVNRGGNITFTNERQGKFEINLKKGKVAGNLTLQDETIDIQITEKPYWLLCKAMESIIKRYM
jgi:hypothetical protein